MSLRSTRPSARPTHLTAAALRRAPLLAVLVLCLALTGAPPATAAPEPAPKAGARKAAAVQAAAAPAALPAVAAYFAGSSPAELTAALQAAAPDLSPVVLERAVAAAACAVAGGVEVTRPLLTVIDYSLPSTKPRLWVFDLARRELLHRELVAHGMGSGDNYARAFSNVEGSKQTSLGLFLTADTYYGKNGYSMRLHGLEKGINHLALPRTIVMHGAPYVSQDFARRVGRLGRSWGCPALREEIARQVIDEVKEGTLLFADHPQGGWLDGSSYLAGSCGGGPAVRTAAHTR
jgi:hypothetical protein